MTAEQTHAAPDAVQPRAVHPVGMTPGHGFKALHRRVVGCTKCPRLRTHCARVAREKKREFRDDDYWGKPVPGFGDPNARLLIVGLAPAAHGANRTGRMFTGDSSGAWLYEALHRFGFASRPVSVGPGDNLELEDCYITAAARCAPPGNRPTHGELDNCREYLERELVLLDHIRVVLVLGHVAYRQWLEAAKWWKQMTPGDRPRFGHGSATSLPDDRTLLCSYHPSRQNTNTGRLTRPMWYAVFRKARTLVGR